MAQAKTKQVTVNIGVVGKSGTGKSTFINTFCALSGRDRARTNAWQECTQATTPYYKIKEGPGIAVCERLYNTDYIFKVWDFPGYGTEKCPTKQYLNTVRETNIDFYLLFSSGRTFDFDRRIHNFIARQDKPYYYIRSRIDQDLKNDQRSHPNTHSEQKVIESVRKDIKTKMTSQVKIFLINAKDDTDFDFPELKKNVLLHAVLAKKDKTHIDPIKLDDDKCTLI